MKKYILRIDRGLISRGERCRGESRFIYLKELSNSVDIITENKKKALVFNENDISENNITVFTKGWEFIKV